MSAGVLITAFGGPRSLDEVGPFIETMTGRPVSDEVLERSQAKYASIGGHSPLPEIADTIVAGLSAELGGRGETVPVLLGMRYATPTIDDAVREMHELDVDTVIALSLSPFESEITTQAYRAAVRDVATSFGMRVLETPGYHEHPALISAHANALQDALESTTARRPFIVFSAHSLPCEEMDRDDTYVRQLAETAVSVARAAGLEEGAVTPAFEGLAPALGGGGARPWTVAYQSRGYRACAWLEPALDAVMLSAVAAGHDGIVIAPVGFVTDHMETRYDLDIVARRVAEGMGVAFVRAAAPNDNPLVIEAFADAVMAVLPE